MPKLRYFSTTGKWEEFSLGPHTTIGRHPDQDLQLLDRMISKEHAEIALNNDGFYVLRDVGSRNGTTLNDESLETPKVLRNGDEIGLGNHILRFFDNDSSEDLDALGDSSLPGVTMTSVKDPEATKQINSNLLNECLSPLKAIRRKMTGARFLPEAQIQSEAEIRQDYERLRVAAELSAEAATTVDFDRLLQIIIEKAFQLFKADRAAILLKDSNGKMVPRIAVDRNNKPIHFKISETLLDEVITEKSAVLSSDALQDHRFLSSNSIVVDNIRSTMCVPLLYQDEILGVINLDTQFMTGAFVEKDLQILTGFAQQAAFSLQKGRLIEEMRKNAIIRDNLKRIISPHLINDVMSGKIQLQKSGREMNSTVLFADIRGFSRMTEQTRNEPEKIVNMLNDFFERMVECIFKNEGVLDKFVGDEVMATWGISVNPTDHPIKAVKCAIAMMNAVRDLNQERENNNLEPFQIGIGVATGPMIVGYMGSTQAMSYTVIGDTVNLGARLCAAAQPGEILINGNAGRSIGDAIDTMQLPPIMVKGKRDPVEIYRVLL